MNQTGNEKLYTYYRGIWEKRKMNGHNPSQEAWDGRAQDWEKELKKTPGFFDGLDKRVNATASWLRSRGLLDSGTCVADIGCGPGRFAAEFARTAKEVTCLDISEKMLEMGKEHVKACGCENVNFLREDFSSFDVVKAGWEGKFDLVFASLTPAVGTVEDLEKLMSISRGCCFNSSFVRWEDELEQRIGRDVFGMENVAPGRGRDDWFYAFFNILWLKGYYPETSYYCMGREASVSADEDQARYYAKCFSDNMTADERNVRRIYDYLRESADSDGKISFREEKWYGWILWDVRKSKMRGIQ